MIPSLETQRPTQSFGLLKKFMKEYVMIIAISNIKLHIIAIKCAFLSHYDQIFYCHLVFYRIIVITQLQNGSNSYRRL